MKIHIIQHDCWVEPGEYLNWANRHEYDVSYTKCWKYEKLPETVTSDFLLILGGLQCPATQLEECDYFDAAAEKTFIRMYIDAGKIVVGVCLGAQLIGEALGAEYEHSPEREIGPVWTRLTEEGRKDPFLMHIPDGFYAGAWHNDMPGLTEDCKILAESDGCPRQIVQYSKYVYGLQTHMEFTHDIILQGIQNAGDSLKSGNRFVQSEEELLAFDYTEMNRQLSGFLDAITGEYMRQTRMTVSEIMERMIAFYRGNIHDIDHFIRVWTYAKMIGEQEGLEAETQYILEVAAIIHDIACPLCRDKYGNTGGKHQEEEGVLLAEEFLKDAGMSRDAFERVLYLVGHHHTLSGIKGIDYQILIEADYLANASENNYSKGNIENFLGRMVKTKSGDRLIRSLFCLSL